MTTPLPLDVSGLAETLVETDGLYFELGARAEALPGASLVRMPGLEHTAAGCVVQRVDPACIGDEVAWGYAVGERLGAVGCRLARIYLLGREPALEAALLRLGYEPREEIGFLAPVPRSPHRTGVRVRPVVTEVDWQIKHLLHEECPVQSDGHEGSAHEWVELERRKAEAGGMTCCLIEVDGEPCGAVATIELGPFLRIKNIVIHPAYRGRGLALATVHELGLVARRRGRRAFGCFAVAGGTGEAVYRRAGLAAVTSQFEWAKDLRETGADTAPYTIVLEGDPR